MHTGTYPAIGLIVRRMDKRNVSKMERWIAEWIDAWMNR